MSKKIVLAEKPSVGRDLSRVLDCDKKGNGYFEGKDHIVTWAMGHLVELASPEHYDKEYATWNLSHLPIIPKKMHTQIIKRTSKQFNIVKKLLLRDDVDLVIIATDAGREGELVARWIIEKSGVSKPIKRLWISSVTDKAIKNGFSSLKDGAYYENLYKSALARAQADWIVGINATRALTTKYNAQLSCGRVQTPTLNLIALREEEIKSFNPRDYWEIKLTAAGNDFKWIDKSNAVTRIFDISLKDSLINKLSKCETADVTEISTKEKSSYPPLLYDLTELQRDANKKFGYSAKETLSIVQRLYENHKILTYPRTDSRHITSDMVSTLNERLQSINYGEYSSHIKTILSRNLRPGKHVVDDSKVTDHHAIIPTEEKVKRGNLSEVEEKIFDLVAKRFISSLLPAYRYNQTKVTIVCEGEVFSASGTVTLSLGWKAVERDDINGQEIKLNGLKEGDSLRVSQIYDKAEKTKPPKLFTEGTLLSEMESPSKYMSKKDKRLARLLEDTGGLGTVATRGDIIEKLFSKFYIEREGQYIKVTPKGQQLLKLVPDELKEPDLTAQWEAKLEKIKDGTLNIGEFISEIKGYSKKIITEIKNDETRFVHTNRTGDKCPECGNYMLKEKDRNGTVLKCSDPDCRKRIRVEKATNARCPQCKKKMTLIGQGETQTFVCKCGYREKMAAFNKRKSQEKSGVSKKEVQKYLNNQNEDTGFNSPFADALKDLKLK
jgi:DNA topoisomerase-3